VANATGKISKPTAYLFLSEKKIALYFQFQLKFTPSSGNTAMDNPAAAPDGKSAPYLSKHNPGGWEVLHNKELFLYCKNKCSGS
jgi:hypothetical protein